MLPEDPTIGLCLQNVRHRFLENLQPRPGQALVHDLDHPDFNPPDCPDWARETLPGSIVPYCGRNGQPHPYRERAFALAMTVKGVDRYQANHFVVCRPETEDFLYSEYTPLRVNYREGTLPALEKLALEVTVGCRTDTEKAMALLNRKAGEVLHPDGLPCGPWVEPDRNLDDEALLADGCGWCNEQARVFIRLCQTCGIPARMIVLFYADEKTGHSIAEFYADGQWRMADPTWLCVFPDSDGRLLSAAQCHDGGEGQWRCGMAYEKRWKELMKLSDREMNLRTPEALAAWRARIAGETAAMLAAKHYYFGTINYPLPR